MSQPKLPKPAPCPVHPEGIPDELKIREQWVVWRWEWTPPTEKAAGKWDKPPYDAKSGRHARSNDPRTWAPFDEAWAAYCDQSKGYSGIGYMFSGQPDDFVGIDLDDCRDPLTGVIRSWSPEQRKCDHWTDMAADPEKVIAALDTYGEVSPSGTGVKLIVRGELPTGIKHGDIEMYNSGRYFTITGHRLRDCPTTVNECGLLSYLRTMFSAKEGPKKRQPPRAPNRHKAHDAATNTSSAPALTVDQVIAACHNAGNGDKFSKLFEGDTSNYPSHSEADAALCSIIAFWSAGYAGLVDCVFRQSKLYRDKWDEVHDGDGRTYGQMTIDSALALTDKFYDWSKLTPAPRVIGELTLITTNVKRTAAKTAVLIQVQKYGKPIDLIKLTEAASSRKDAVKAILVHIPDERDAKRKATEVLGQILVEAACVQGQSCEGDGKEINEILAEYVPGEVEFQYVTDDGKAFSGKLNRLFSRRQFIEWFLNETVIALAGTGIDAPRDENDDVVRLRLVSIIKCELEVLWGEVISQLKLVADADLSNDSPAAVDYRQAIVSLWTRPTSMGIHKTVIQKGASVQLATRNSLALRVQRLRESGIEPGRWHIIQPGFDAYVRIEPGTGGEFSEVLGMRFELAQQIGMDIPDTTNQTALKRLGVKFAAIAQAPTAHGRRIPERMSGGDYLAVLTPPLTGRILAMPSEECDEADAATGRAVQENSGEGFAASETATDAHLSPSEGVSDGSRSLEERAAGEGSQS